MRYETLHTSYPFTYSQIWKLFITLSTELTKVCCFWSWLPSSCGIIKSCLDYSRRRKHCWVWTLNTWIEKNAQYVLHHPSLILSSYF